MHAETRLIEAANMILTEPVDHAREGLPIGNGRMGTLVWTTPASLEFQINRVDVFAVNRNTASEHYWPTRATNDYCGACARISIDLGGQALGSHFRQSLSLGTARCTVEGQGVSAECWVAPEDDVLVVTVSDERPTPLPIEVTLSMWGEPHVQIGDHTASYVFRQDTDRIAVVRAFSEADHYCSSAVAVACADAEAQVIGTDPTCRLLRLPAAPGTRTLLIAGAASWDKDVDAGATTDALLTKLTAADALAAASEQHAHWWRRFWQRTHVDIASPDGRGEQAARDRLHWLYHMASSSRGQYPPKWNGSIFSTEGDTRHWGSQFWLWTTETAYWPLHAADAGDLAAPFFALYHNALPAMTTAARQRWDAAGFFLPETMPFDGPTELPEDLLEAYRERLLHNPRHAEVPPALAGLCKYDWHLEASTNRRLPDSKGYNWISHLVSSGAELAVHAWWHYRYAGDEKWLRTHAYPLLRGVAEFYRSLCKKGDDGHCHLHDTNAHEDFWGITDSIMDLAAIRGTLPLAIRAAEQLEVDEELRPKWKALLDHLAPYPLPDDPRAQQSIDGVLGDGAWAAGYSVIIDNSLGAEDVQLTPVFPFEDWTLETEDPAVDPIAHRTLELSLRHRQVFEGDRLTTAIRSPIAAVRTGAAEALPAILEHYRASFSPLANGFSLFEGETARSIEHLGLLTMTLQEALLQSIAPRPGRPEIIRVFPAWPRDWDASFRLLARGGFLVSASMEGGQIAPVEIESRRGETCRLRNPWPTACQIETPDGQVCAQGGPSEVVVFSTHPGVRYSLRIQDGGAE